MCDTRKLCAAECTELITSTSTHKQIPFVLVLSRLGFILITFDMKWLLHGRQTNERISKYPEYIVSTEWENTKDLKISMEFFHILNWHDDISRCIDTRYRCTRCGGRVRHRCSVHTYLWIVCHCFFVSTAQSYPFQDHLSSDVMRMNGASALCPRWKFIVELKVVDASQMSDGFWCCLCALCLS